ncbi:hypothetical protein ACET3X_001887 [Alternaria dauci]|uniref:Uncharacterized protein n=1 Tax=Alternaria dauci TaxID=48095 RepID=A0ABR3UZK3_9PLEO
MTTMSVLPSSSMHLRANCLNALKQERNTESELQDSYSKIERLRERVEILHKKTAANKHETAAAFLALAKNDCLEFCHKVYKTFPREIRDIIYGYIIECGGVLSFKSVQNSWSELDYFASSSETQYRLGLPTADADHWWKRDFVGAKMVREIGEHYYRSSHFRFEARFSNFAKFRATDQFNLGFRPVYFVSNVEIVVDCGRYEFRPTTSVENDDASLSGSEDQLPWEPYTSSWGESETQEHLLVELESLFGFRPGTAIAIRLIRPWNEENTCLENQEWMCHNVVPVIFPVLQRLKEANCRTRILLGKEDSDRPMIKSKKKSKTKRNIKYSFYASKWNPESLEAITTDFLEYFEAKHGRAPQSEVQAESDESVDVVDPSDSSGDVWIVTNNSTVGVSW